MSTVTALARRFRVQVDTNYPGAAAWATLIGVTDLKPALEPTLQPTQDYEGEGWKTNEVTEYGWTLVITLLRKKVDAAFPLAQETLRLASEGEFGEGALAHVRWYDRDNGLEAFEGVGFVKWERAQSGVADVESVTVTITGQGEREIITNPGV